MLRSSPMFSLLQCSSCDPGYRVTGWVGSILGIALIPVLTFCSSAPRYLLSDQKMKNADWVSYQSPEVNEFVLVEGRQVNCRHIVDSVPSFGGAILSHDLEITSGGEFELSFWVKVVSGTATVQILEAYGTDKAEPHSFGDLVDRSWTHKIVFFRPVRNSTRLRVNFTNLSPSAGVNFYVGDVLLRRRTWWEQRATA